MLLHIESLSALLTVCILLPSPKQDRKWREHKLPNYPQSKSARGGFRSSCAALCDQGGVKPPDNRTGQVGTSLDVSYHTNRKP